MLAVLLCCTAIGADEGTADKGRSKSAEPALRFVRSLAARSKGLRSLHVRFRQEKRLRILRRPRTSQGEIWYSDGRLSMKVRRQGVLETHLLMKDGRLEVLYPRLKRMETLQLDSQGGGRRRNTMAIPFLSGDWEAAERDYVVTLREEEAEGSSSGTRVVLDLVPRASESPVESLRMVFVDEQLREYSQEEKSGNEVRMEILSWEENREIPSQHFRMEAPAGTKTVRLR